MAEELATFLEGLSPVVSEDVVWDDRMRLHVSVYLSEIPPQRYVTSARAVVLRNGGVLVAQDQDTLRHILPGGRLKENEIPETALRREIGEESGWMVDRIKLLGFMRFSHLDPKQPDYHYPYPDFVQLVYAAEAIAYHPDLIAEDDYVIGMQFMPVSVVRRMALTPKERMFLDAACGVVRNE